MNIDKSKLSTGPCASGNGELKTDISKLPLNTDKHLSAKKRMSAIPQKEYDWEIPGTVDPFRGQDIKERFYSHVTNIRIMHRSFKPFCPSGELSPEQAVRLDGAAQLIGKYKSADDRRRSALGYLGLEYSELPNAASLIFGAETTRPPISASHTAVPFRFVSPIGAVRSALISKRSGAIPKISMRA